MNNLQNPSLIRMKSVTRDNPEALKELIKRYESAKDDKVRIDCLRALNASEVQTVESIAFIKQISESDETAEKIRNYAQFGNQLNHLSEILKDQSTYFEPREYPPEVRRIGDRYMQLMNHFDPENPAAVEVIFSLAADNLAKAEADELMSSKIDDLFQEFLATEDDTCTWDEHTDLKLTTSMLCRYLDSEDVSKEMASQNSDR